MNKSQKMLFLVVMAIFGAISLTYSQKTVSPFKDIEQHKSYIFVKYLKPSPKNVKAEWGNASVISLYHKNELPLFCKMEFLINQKSHIPVKIRLGDIEYVDMLESKSIFIK